MLKKIVAFVCMLLLSSSVAPAVDVYDELKSKIVRFDKVDENLYRGSQPAMEDFALLKAFGIKKVINFRTEPEWIEKEKKVVEGLGMEYISIPWFIYKPYREDVVSEFFSAIKNKDTAPVFFHCKRGADRTGTIAGICKIKKEGISAEEAYRYANHYDTHFLWRPFIKAKLNRFYNNIHTSSNQ
jgi:protein tyrosine phosphatase (PTP) superfamily phosphohydrolase (DUF442 family)